jgi:predicted Zn-dependent protease
MTYAGVLLQDEGDIPDALTYLDRAIALDPQAAQPRAFRAVALLDLGRAGEAARDCEQVLATVPRPPGAFQLLLGYIRVHQGRLADAQSAFEVAARQEPANVSAQFVLGCALLARGESQAGRAALDRAVRLEPTLAGLREVVLQRVAAGDVAGVERLIELTRRTTDSESSIRSMVDSVRVGRG